MIKKIHILGIILASVLLVSCIEERLSADDTENASAYLQVRGNSLLSSTDPLDNEIKNLRILAFKKSLLMKVCMISCFWRMSRTW